MDHAHIDLVVGGKFARSDDLEHVGVARQDFGFEHLDPVLGSGLGQVFHQYGADATAVERVVDCERQFGTAFGGRHVTGHTDDSRSVSARCLCYEPEAASI